MPTLSVIVATMMEVIKTWTLHHEKQKQKTKTTSTETSKKRRAKIGCDTESDKPDKGKYQIRNKKVQRQKLWEKAKYNKKLLTDIRAMKTDEMAKYRAIKRT